MKRFILILISLLLLYFFFNENGSCEQNTDENQVETAEEQVETAEEQVETDEEISTENVTEDKYYVFNLGMITQEWWEHPDGSITIRCRTLCTACSGRNVCNICQGTGNGYSMLVGSGRYMPCPACGATGQCGTCHGLGYRETVKIWQPGEAEAYIKAHKEVEQEYRNQGGRRLGKPHRGIRVKEYSPNYTGEYEEVWCEECKGYDAPHYHRWKQ
ncbi:MAG: hypothetical protein J6B33_00825 [Prevotella sp.]|nr:hypothetical protein [Prevotella sp.]